MKNDEGNPIENVVPTQVDTSMEILSPESISSASMQRQLPSGLPQQNSDSDLTYQFEYDSELPSNVPLAELIRPRTLKDYIGQLHLINDDNGSIKNYIRLGFLPSMILYGPPGVGKTTIAYILARETKYVFMELSATYSTVADMKRILTEISSENTERKANNEEPLHVVVFIDEIHRFSKTQQDFLLPYIESGHFVFIGATTVNPKARIRRAILSRCQIYNLKPLSEVELEAVLRRAIFYNNIRRRLVFGVKFLRFNDEVIRLIAKDSRGDSRAAIGIVELVSGSFIDATKKELVYNTGDHEPFELTKTMIQRTLKTNKDIGGNSLQLKDSKNMNLYLKLFDTMRGVERYRDIELIQSVHDKVVQGGDRSFDPPITSTQTDVTKFSSKIKFKDNEGKHDTIKNSIDFSTIYSTYTKKELEEKIHNSDDSDFEQDYLLSDTDSDAGRDEEGFFSYMSYEDQTVYLAKYYLNAILERGESPLFIVKQLILFTCLYTDSKAVTLSEAVSMIKTLKNSSSDATKMLANFVERTTKARKRTITSELWDPIKRLRKMKGFCKQHNEVRTDPSPNDETVPVTFDEELVTKLLEEDFSTAEEPPVEGDQNINFQFPVEQYDVEKHSTLFECS
ncbi:hypothetical protein CLIB1423_01S10682 [[Candida] railenensis]|uniref:AAA+ ATPase domain-containing protein n=1 Tax=[Candida] railenensis TaxID=45579 RepID=A0A9P0QJU9_9ASCO|nr:hypothetical protein CLIB1423_01S10682 [[Candida] railenensis]